MCRKSFLQILVVVAITLVSCNAAFAIVWEGRIASSTDDWEQLEGGGMRSATSSDIEMPYEDTGKGDKQISGLRFLDVKVPKGANITAAYIEFVVDEDKGGTEPVSILIEGELSSDAAPFTGNTDFSTTPKTSATAVWDVEDWTTVGTASQTTDISAIILEIISQDGWASGNAIAIIVSDNPDNPSQGVRCAESFNGSASAAALLHIEFSSKYASNPTPANGILHEDTWASLSWDAGETAVSHDVYMSDSFDDVSAGAVAAFQGNLALAFTTVGFPGFAYPDGLVPGTTYYWRIDEIDADGVTKYEGPVWSFWIPSKAAYDPSPRDGGKAVDPNVTLSWTTGFGAKLHSVYFGDDFDTVSNAVGSPPQATVTFTPGTLEKDKIYYWRVDEFNPPETVKGDVWSFRTLPDIVITDPDLIGWWKLDNISGTTVLDWSGYGNDGTIGGDPQLVEGATDFALDLDGDDYVSMNGIVDDLTTTNLTVSAWIRTTQAGEGNVFAANSGGSHPFMFGVLNGNPFVNDGGDTEFPPAVNDDQWHMITFVRSGSRGTVYVDAVQQGTYTAAFDLTGVDAWSIGQEWDGSTPSDFYRGMVDDARIYNKALTQPEVAELMRGDPLLAWNPQPGNKTTLDVEQAVQPLSWSAGDDASQHDVYFGTDRDAVKDADTSTADIYRGRQAGTSYSPPEGLEWGTGPYYWRVDEINSDDSISAGSVWSLSVADFLIVDDFESYNDIEETEPGSNRLYLTWLDGFDNPTTNGAIVGNLNVPIAETRSAYVNNGSQAMPLSYNNTGKSSEATLMLTGADRDWTRQGVGQLSLWFRGDAVNGAERLYIALNGQVVYHTNPSAAQVDVYEEWVIPLQTFADLGVTLNNVTSIAIGLGNPPAGGAGTVYIDDIRLYRTSQ